MLTSGGRRGYGPGRRLQRVYNPQQRLQQQRTHTFEEDLQLERITGRVKYLFYDWRGEGSYQRGFFLCATLTKRQNASFLPAKASAYVRAVEGESRRGSGELDGGSNPHLNIDDGG